MKETRKSRSMMGVVGDAELFLRETFIEKPVRWVRDAREKTRDLPKTNFDLGCKFAEQGKWYDALFRFRIALFLRPEYPQALFNVGCCYFNLRQMDKAKAALQKVLQQAPHNSDALLMLSAVDPAAVSPAQRPQTIPADLVKRFFTSVAPDYNRAEAQSRYRGGNVVAEQVKPLLPGQGIHVVDLGCGTGIASIPYRPMAAAIIGVDMTPAMVAQARLEMQADKKLFDEVIEADLATSMTGIVSGTADLVLLVNVVQFVGALEAAFLQVARLLKPQGILALTIEPYTRGDNFGILAETGRFGHASTYVKQAAAAAGLQPARQTAVEIYDGSPAELIIFRKAG